MAHGPVPLQGRSVSPAYSRCQRSSGASRRKTKAARPAKFGPKNRKMPLSFINRTLADGCKVGLLARPSCRCTRDRAAMEGEMRTKLNAILAILLGVSAVVGTIGEAKEVRSGAVNFPSDGITDVASKSGVKVYYVDPGPNADGEDERSIRLRYPTGETEQIDTFTRNADVSWSPRGDWLVETNWIGSNVADCIAVRPSTSGSRKKSLTALIGEKGHAAVSRDIREGDHVYVSCGRWLSPNRVEVEARGNGCHPAPCTPRSFDHHLIYDVRLNRLSAAIVRAPARRYRRG